MKTGLVSIVLSFVLLTSCASRSKQSERTPQLLGNHRQCFTSNLEVENAKFDEISDLTTEQKQSLKDGAATIKYSQILACLAVKQKLSKEDAYFALARVESDRRTKVAEIQNNVDYLKQLINDPESEKYEVELFQNSINAAPARIAEENKTAQYFVKRLKRSMK